MLHFFSEPIIHSNFDQIIPKFDRYLTTIIITDLLNQISARAQNVNFVTDLRQNLTSL